MFTPCCVGGKVLTDPGLLPSQELSVFREAKNNVLFDGWEVKYTSVRLTTLIHKGVALTYGFGRWKIRYVDVDQSVDVSTIEDLIPLKLKLTLNALNSEIW